MAQGFQPLTKAVGAAADEQAPVVLSTTEALAAAAAADEQAPVVLSTTEPAPEPTDADVAAETSPSPPPEPKARPTARNAWNYPEAPPWRRCHWRGQEAYVNKWYWG